MAELPSEEGRITTLHLGDYKLPGQMDIPELVTVLLRGEEGPVPFGGQAIAEASNVPAAAAIANAVSDAIGIQIDQLPVSAERVYQALQGNGK
jgi:CO/xanthine dehydrogenase Mo-binding subunit